MSRSRSDADPAARQGADGLVDLAWLVEQTVEHVSVSLSPRRVVVRLVHRPTGAMVTEHGLSSDGEGDVRLSAYHSLQRMLERAAGLDPDHERR